MNKEIRQLQDDLISLLNGSPIPIEVKRLILVNTLALAEKEADKAIMSELTVKESGDAEST